MTFDITRIRNELTQGGARTNLFQVQFTNPVNSIADLKVPFMVHSTETPSDIVGEIQVPWMGATIRVPGDREHGGNWSVMVYNDENYVIKNAMEAWSNEIKGRRRNVRGFASPGPNEFVTDAIVTHFGKKNNIIRRYRYYNIWPTVVSGGRLDWSPNQEIQSFEIRFAYDYWLNEEVGTGNGGGA